MGIADEEVRHVELGINLYGLLELLECYGEVVNIDRCVGKSDGA